MWKNILAAYGLMRLMDNGNQPPKQEPQDNSGCTCGCLIMIVLLILFYKCS